VSRVEFKTGQAHQEAAAKWARRRLADNGGRRFLKPDDQDGVLLADSVGMGKTWEAVGAAALVLYKQRLRGMRHVLVLCPANLITKWEDELSKGSALNEVITAWARTKNGSYAQRVQETLQYVLPVRRSKHVLTRKHHDRFRPEAGTYIVSHGLITRKGHGLAALCRQSWDVIIVDEAHQALARKAIAAVEKRKRAKTKILLSATPFQLEPRQWNAVARHLIKGNQRIFSRPELRDYTKRVEQVFCNPKNEGPSRAQVDAASETLRKIAVRSTPGTSRRTYAFLLPDGRERSLKKSLDQLDDGSVQELLRSIRDAFPADEAFERAYLKYRFDLASKSDRTYVATKLRRFLSMGTTDAPSPRLRALEHSARQWFTEDLQHALKTGLPQKTIVFTSWVGPPKVGEADRLRDMLDHAFSSAVAELKAQHRVNWKRWHADGLRLLRGGECNDVLQCLARNELTAVLSGAQPKFASQVRENLKRRHGSIRNVEEELKTLDDKRGVVARALRRRLADMRAGLNPWSGRHPLRAVERYTGQDRRADRDRVATGFREVGPPWVLVASQVGAEGIDLQVYTRRIVHYDLEWNPARMEQREGRGDRVGRRLKEKLSILYCLVPGTYDERMFHQLVARDRWHGVLLGRPSQALDDDEADAPLLDRKRLKKMRIVLTPS
jgi:SNF2 family DNA or RNA helicase